MANFNFNQIILGGRLTADPELKTTQSGKSVTKFSIAVNKRGTNGEQRADFFDCVAWDGRAEFITRYFRKGNCICVVGSLSNRSYTDSSGQKRTVTEITVSESCFVDGKNENGNAQAVSQTESYNPAVPYIPQSYMQNAVGGFAEMAEDEELPF